MSDIIFGAVLDGDLQTKIGVVEYSTSPREVVTIGDMLNREEMLKKRNEGKLKLNSLYGKSVKGMVIDETI